MDGFAVRAPLKAGDYKVVSSVFAGDTVEAGENQLENNICYITTGSRVPDWCNSVVKIEDTVYNSAAEVRINIDVAPNTYIRQIGSDIALGQLLVSKQTTISPIEIALLASVGIRTIRCHRNPTVGVISTGNELVDYNAPLDSTTAAAGAADTSSTIRDTNRPALIASFRSTHGIEVRDYGIIRDERDGLRAALQRAIRECDVVISTGGVSMGSADLVKPLLAELGKIIFGTVLVCL